MPRVSPSSPPQARVVPGLASYPHLFSEGRLGRLALRNRVVMPAMGTGYGAPDGRVTERHLRYYAARARGGAGLIITEVVKVENQVDPTPAGNLLRLDSDLQVGGFSDLVEVVHDGGAKACIQLTPGFGRQGDPPDPGRPPVSSADVPAFTNPNVVCHGLSREEIARIVRAFGEAAGRAALAGFDAIEIHGHTGYLVDQFLSSAWNRRTDGYGGPLANRVRFAVELIRAVRERLGPDFPLSFRFSAELKTPNDRSLAEAREIAHHLVEAGATALHVDAGCYESMPWIFPPMYFGLGCILDLAAAVKEAVGPSVPVVAVGNIFDPDLAEQAIAAGKCDFVASGRGLIADPDWPRKAWEGRADEICRCIMCNEYCVGKLLQGKPLGCTVNPLAGKEGWYEVRPAAERRKVVVAGGGPAGMQAACTAAERGHDVILFEKADRLGGQLLLAAAPEFKKSLLYPVRYLSGKLERLGVSVRLGTEATARRIAREKPDAVVVATGARPLIPPLEGVRRKNVVTAWDVHRGSAPGLVGEKIVVAGGGLVGCETALDLARRGGNVTIVEMLPEVATDLNPVNRFALIPLLHEAKVRILTGHRVTAFVEEGVRVVGPDGAERLVEGGTVVLAFGAEPETALADELRGGYARLLVVGDCAAPRKIGAAIHEGFAAGLQV